MTNITQHVVDRGYLQHRWQESTQLNRRTGTVEQKHRSRDSKKLW